MDLYIRGDNNDLEIVNGDFRLDSSLHSSVILKLKTHARADDDEIRIGDNPRGWWASPMGSKLWLAQRLKIQPNTPARVEEYIREALQEFIDEGVAISIDVDVEVRNRNQIHASIVIHRDNGFEERYVWNNLWDELIDAHHELERVQTSTPVTDYLLTQDNNVLITENGDRLVWR